MGLRKEVKLHFMKLNFIQRSDKEILNKKVIIRVLK